MPDMTQEDAIRKLRKSKGMSQADLANAADLSMEAVWRAENEDGSSYPETIKKIADALDISPGVLQSVGSNDLPESVRERVEDAYYDALIS